VTSDGLSVSAFEMFGKHKDIQGNRLYAFVLEKGDFVNTDDLVAEIETDKVGVGDLFSFPEMIFLF
jgi:hypothetical protein